MSTPAIRVEASGSTGRIVGIWALLLIAALYIVGIESHGIVRHFVQTAPIWPSVVLALRRSEWSKWTALPCFVFWFSVMALIWMTLLGIAPIFSGHFTPIEITLTLVIGVCSTLGFIAAVKMRTHKGAIGASAAFCGILLLQILALRISFLPAIAHDRWR